MEIDPTVTPQDPLCPRPDILKVRNPFLKSAGQVFSKSNGLALQRWYDLGSVQAVHNRLLFHTFGELIACNHNAHFAKEENGKQKLVDAQGSEGWLCAARKTAATLLRAH